jgi:hypothetical protein
MVNSVALDVNHGFMLCLCKGNALASGDEDSVSCFFVPENDEVLWEALTYLVWWDPWHVVRNVFGVL